MTDSLTHLESFRITVQSPWGLRVGPTVEDRMERGLRFKVSCGSQDFCFLMTHIGLLGSPQKVLNPGCL